jgi:hypothetical protein
MAMTETKHDMPTEPGGTEITRFNALRHGVLGHVRQYGGNSGVVWGCH